MPGRSTRAWEARLAVLAITLGVAPAAMAQQAASQPRMAPIVQYMMPDAAAEVALARTAAPKAISSDATVMVLGQAGYVQASKGGNGFVCLVERSWTSAFDDPGFWNAKNRSPECYNPAAARSLLPEIYKRTQLVLAGLSRERIRDSITAAFAAHALPSPEPGAMIYMMSKLQRIGTDAERWHPHLMVELPKDVGADWGANADGAPILANPEPLSPSMMQFVILVAKWSDGTISSSH